VVRRVLIIPPTHPALIATYTVLGLVVALAASGALSAAIVSWLGRRALPLAAAVSWLLALSPPLSFVNIVVARVRSRAGYAVQVELEYVEAFGIPVPVPRPKIVEVENEVLIAVNLGGAIIPLIVASLLLYAAYVGIGGYAVLAAVVATAVTTVVTYAVSRVIPMVGIVVPAFVPPVVSASTAVLLLGVGPAAAAVAYFAGVVGSLLGADVLRLSKDFDKIMAPLASIGGAGVFDGVFLSGVLAALLAA